MGSSMYTYAGSVEDSDLNFHDLYYLKKFSLARFIILFRTIKTVLKAAGGNYDLIYLLLTVENLPNTLY